MRMEEVDSNTSLDKYPKMFWAGPEAKHHKSSRPFTYEQEHSFFFHSSFSKQK